MEAEIKADLKGSSTTGPVVRNGIKGIHTAVFSSIYHPVCEKLMFQNYENPISDISTEGGMWGKSMKNVARGEKVKCGANV